MTEFHKLLNVSRSASLQEIKIAYRKLALQYHPDMHPTEKRSEYEEKFKKITEAYNILTRRPVGQDFPSSSAKSTTTYYNYSNNSPFNRPYEPYQGSNFNTETWRAWHYGENAEAVDSVRQVKPKMEDLTKTQRYYAKRRQRAAEKAREEYFRAAEEYRNETLSNLEKRRAERIQNGNPDKASDEGCTIS
jgi:curved DNA-binding protein CbpA